MGWWDIPSAEETEIPKVLHQDHVDNFFNSQGVVHKQFIPEGKTVNNAEFYKGVMDCLLKCIQRVCPAAFCSWDFFLLHNNAPAHMLHLPIFDPKKCYNLLSSPYSPHLSLPDYFLFPKLKIKLKGLHFADVTEIQEAITDELKKVQKEEFSAAFQKLYNCAKACIYASGAYFEVKKGMCLPQVSLSFKKISPKTFGPHCVLCVLHLAV